MIAQQQNDIPPLAIAISGGLIAALLDIAYAAAFWSVRSGVSSQRIFQSVAAGLIGPAAFEGGARTVALGLALHFFIGVTMALVYYLASSRLDVLWRKPWLCGAVYGLLLYVAMNYVVVPLSAAGAPSRIPLWVGLTIAVHVFLIGMPIALAARSAQRLRRGDTPGAVALPG